MLELFQDHHSRAARKTVVKSSAHIRSHVQDFSWGLARLDVLGNEVQNLLQRYKGEVVLGAGTRDVTLRVLFESANAGLSVDFSIPVVYPSLPLAVKMDVKSGDFDTEALHRVLKKNAKPGFGSLSRACDILSSMVR